MNFIVSRGAGSSSRAVYMLSTSSLTSFSKEHLNIFAGIRVKGSQAIVDTAAEDAVIGAEALKMLQRELANYGLQVLSVNTERQVPCAGIGGEATASGIVDVPTAIAGLHGVLRFNVLNDSQQFHTPPLLPISYLEAVRAILDFKNDRYCTADGYSAPMVRLPSGHRVIDILSFDRPWKLPSQFTGDQPDPFLMSGNTEQEFRGRGSEAEPTGARSSVLPLTTSLTSASTARASETSSTQRAKSALRMLWEVQKHGL